MSSCLKRCSVFHELNNIDARRSRSIGGVIVVDVGGSQSTCHGRDAYIHDRCLRYRHKYVFFYQLLNINLFTHRMFSLKREASSETYGPRVYFPSYKFPIYNSSFLFTFLG